MAQRTAVGLDIGTTGVRAAELSLGKDLATLERFGQVALPPGAVRNGEVVDVEAVAAAIKQLWAATKFRTKKVIVGVANQKVIVRQVDLPWLPEAELRAALPLQVSDHIPMPVEEAILDFHALEEYESEAGARMVSVMLVAAAKDMVRSTVDAVTLAGLRPVMVDLTPFALLRALGTLDELGLYSEDAEALVDIGASVTNIVIHQGGVPRFVRILLMGGGDITDAVAERLGVDSEQAEAVKQNLGIPVQPGVAIDAAPAARIIESRGAAFVEGVVGSLDYYRSQNDAARISRIVLSGGGGRLTGLAERLGSATRLPVVQGSAISRLRVGKVGLSPEQMSYLEPLASTPVGLAMGARA